MAQPSHKAPTEKELEDKRKAEEKNIRKQIDHELKTLGHSPTAHRRGIKVDPPAEKKEQEA